MKTIDQVFAFAKEKYELVLQKVYQQNKMLNTYMMTLNTFDNKFETLIELLEKKGTLVYTEFEDLFDHNTGWRKVSPTEDITSGHVVWVDYKMTSDEVKEKVPEGWIGEKDMPIRIGAKAVIFEDALLNRRVDETFEYEHEDKDKTYTFEIKITKAKAKVGVSKYGTDESDIGNGIGRENTNETQSEPTASL